MAISGKLTWSWYPVSSILFGWVVLIPFVKCGRKGLPGSLATLSVSIIPFLYVIDRIIGRTSILPIAVPIALLSVVYLWCVYWIFRKRNTRKLSAGGWSLLLAIPLCLGINWMISRFFSEPVLDIWDVAAFAILTVSAVALWIVDYRKNQKG